MEQISFASSISSPRSDGSSTFSSPIHCKRVKLEGHAPTQTRREDCRRVGVSSEELKEIYGNSRRCGEIEKHLKQRKWRMASFRATIQVADLIFSQWELASPNRDALYRQRKQHFSNYVVGFVLRVGPSVATLLHGLLYCLRLRKLYPQARGEQGCAHRLFVVSLLVATRYLNDRQVLIKPNHTTWSSLSGVFTAPELERMEMEFVTFLRGNLFIGWLDMHKIVEDHFGLSEGRMDLGCIVPGSVDWMELISVAAVKSSASPEEDALVP